MEIETQQANMNQNKDEVIDWIEFNAEYSGKEELFICW